MSERRATYNAGLSEHDIQAHIMAYLTRAHWYVQRMNVGRQRHDMAGIRPGTPDVWALKGGRLLCIEVKRPGQTPDLLQRQVMQELDAHGAVCFVATSLEDVQQVVEEGG